MECCLVWRRSVTIFNVALYHHHVRWRDVGLERQFNWKILPGSGGERFVLLGFSDSAHFVASCRSLDVDQLQTELAS